MYTGIYNTCSHLRLAGFNYGYRYVMRRYVMRRYVMHRYVMHQYVMHRLYNGIK